MPELVLIEWLDSHQGRGWQGIEDIPAKPLYCRSVGWLLKETKEVKVIVPHLSGEEGSKEIFQGTGELVIPSRAIVRMKKISCGNKPFADDLPVEGSRQMGRIIKEARKDYAKTGGVPFDG